MAKNLWLLFLANQINATERNITGPTESIPCNFSFLLFLLRSQATKHRDCVGLKWYYDQKNNSFFLWISKLC